MEPLTKESEKTIVILIGFLKKARVRWTLLLLVSFVGLLANFASTNQPKVPSDASKILHAYEVLREVGLPRIVRSAEFQTWLPKEAIRRIEAAQKELNEAKQRLLDKEIENNALNFFTLGPRYAGFVSAVTELSSNLPPADLLAWEKSQIDHTLTLFAGLYATDLDQPGSDREVKLSNSAVVEKNPAIAADINAIKAFAGSLSANESAAQQAKRITNALGAIVDSLAELNSAFPNWPKESGTQLAEADRVMETWHVSKVSSAIESAKAQVTAGILKSGSISAAGLSIPGVAIKLLLPLLAFGIAIDILLTLAKAVRWSRQSMLQRDAAYHVALFPWIPILIFGGRRQTGFAPKLLSMIAVAIHFSPPVMLLTLIYTDAGSTSATAIAGAAVAGVAFCQVGVVWLIDQLSKHSSDRAVYKLNLNDPTADLIKTHLERIDVAWTTLMTVSAAASVFFIAYLFVPSELLGDRSQLVKVRNTRAALEVVYEQRFKEHRDTYDAWSKNVDDAFHELTFMQTYFPEDHPGHRLIDTLSQKPPLHTYPSAISNFNDIVTEDRASIEQLDLYDINDLIELLYRANLEDLIEPLNEIRASLQQQPLSEEAASGLPEFLKLPPKKDEAGTPLKPLYGKVSGTGDAVSSTSIPLPVTYRQEVEKAGFAYRLTPLPVRADVDQMYRYMEEGGFTKVAGFDEFLAAYERFDEQLGTIKLSLFGVQVDRRLATTVASWLIVPLIALLLLRLFVAKRVFDRIDDEESCATILSTTGITYLHDGGTSKRTFSLIIGTSLLAFPLFVLLLIEWSSAPSPFQLDWSMIALIVGLVLTVLCIGERQGMIRLLLVTNGNF